MARRKLELLERLVRLRRVEKLRAAAQAAEAQGVHHKLLALHLRSEEIARGLQARGGAADGDELLRRMVFASGLHTIRTETGEESRKAESHARGALESLRAAGRRHELVGEHVAAEKRRAEMRAESAAATVLARKLNNR